MTTGRDKRMKGGGSSWVLSRRREQAEQEETGHRETPAYEEAEAVSTEERVTRSQTRREGDTETRGDGHCCRGKRARRGEGTAADGETDTPRHEETDDDTRRQMTTRRQGDAGRLQCSSLTQARPW
ncbi:unnamed protein product [Lampetra planeri]